MGHLLYLLSTLLVIVEETSRTGEKLTSWFSSKSSNVNTSDSVSEQSKPENKRGKITSLYHQIVTFKHLQIF